MSQIVNVTGVTQVTNVQVEAAIQKLVFVLGGVGTLAQLQAVTIEVRKVGQQEGTSTLIFEGPLQNYIEMDAQLENGTFQVFANNLIGSVTIARDNSMYIGQGDNLTLNIKNLIATMTVNVYGLETKMISRSYAKFMPMNIPGIAPKRQKVTFEDVLFVPNDGTITEVQVMYKGRTVTYQLAELQAINRSVRSVISPNYGGAVYAGFVNWLGFNLKDVVEIELQPSNTNVNTNFYMVDAMVIMEEQGRVMIVNKNPALVDSTKKDFGGVKNVGVMSGPKAMR